MLAIHIKEIRKHKIFIATPMYGGQCFGPYVESLLGFFNLANDHKISYQTNFVYGESLIQRARNYLADMFLRSDCTHLMFIDGDIEFEAMYLLALLAVANPKSDKDIVTGIYPKKKIRWDNIKKATDKGLVDDPEDLAMFSTTFAFNLAPGTKDFEITEPVEILEGATGFMMIQRHVLEGIAEKHPEMMYTPDDSSPGSEFSIEAGRKICAFFDCRIDPVTNRYLSEDYAFSQLARSEGYKVWACPWMQFGHIGSHMFRGSILALSELETNLA
jgi:hypothetical protein